MLLIAEYRPAVVRFDLWFEFRLAKQTQAKLNVRFLQKAG
jgi:hypothetical protein